MNWFRRKSRQEAPSERPVQETRPDVTPTPADAGSDPTTQKKRRRRGSRGGHARSGRDAARARGAQHRVDDERSVPVGEHAQVAQDRLGDLGFLIGRWEGGPKGEEVSLSFTKDPDGPFIDGKFTRRVGGKPGPTGTIRIGLDGERGQIRSWHFDADGRVVGGEIYYDQVSLLTQLELLPRAA